MEAVGFFRKSIDGTALLDCEVSMSGPFDRWPTSDGFEKVDGFVGDETNQWAPTLYLGTSPVEPWGTAADGYHFSEDMVDKAISWVRGTQTMTPDKSFFLYVSFGATHAPHHVPKENIDKYKQYLRQNSGLEGSRLAMNAAQRGNDANDLVRNKRRRGFRQQI